MTTPKTPKAINIEKFTEIVNEYYKKLCEKDGHDYAKITDRQVLTILKSLAVLNKNSIDIRAKKNE